MVVDSKEEVNDRWVDGYETKRVEGEAGIVGVDCSLEVEIKHVTGSNLAPHRTVSLTSKTACSGIILHGRIKKAISRISLLITYHYIRSLRVSESRGICGCLNRPYCLIDRSYLGPSPTSFSSCKSCRITFEHV